MIDTEPVVVTTLDRQDIRALRNADSVIFRQHKGQGTIEAVKDGRSTTDGYDQTHYVYVGCSIEDYDREHTGMTGPENVSAFHMESSAKFSTTLPTLLRRLSVGDTITLRWTLDNNNDIVREHGLHVDMLHMRITKKTGAHETYLVRTSVGYDNSARMIRRTV